MKKRNSSIRPVKLAPQRTCVACRQVKNKRELIRLIGLADGSVEIDPTGKKAGRGAYLCRRRECWASGLKGRRLEHSLKTILISQQREQLLKAAEKLFTEETG